MCINKVIELLAPSRLPHPEEPQDLPAQSRFQAMTPDQVQQWLNSVLDTWIRDWEVLQPDVFRDLLRVVVTMEISYPAGTSEENGKRLLAVRPEWLNSGVIAHEQGHNSYALLDAGAKEEWPAVFAAENSLLVRALRRRTSYWSTSPVEAHAEVARYIGQYMPDRLRPYFPGLYVKHSQ